MENPITLMTLYMNFDHSDTRCIVCVFPISVEIKDFGCIQETTTSLVSSMTLVRAHSAASSSSLIIEFEDGVNPIYVDMSSSATVQTYKSQDTRETKTTKNNINFVIVQCLCFQPSSTNFSIQCMFAWYHRDENENENCSHRITIIIIDIVSFSRIFHSCFIQKVSISHSHERERSFLPTDYSDELKSSFSQTHLKSVPLVQRNFTPSLPSLPSLQTWYP